jgi:NADPH:quinone reductase
LVASGELDPQVGWRGPWTRFARAVDALRARQVRGKVVLDVKESGERP